jgi:hypothetical protein
MLESIRLKADTRYDDYRRFPTLSFPSLTRYQPECTSVNPFLVATVSYPGQSTIQDRIYVSIVKLW